MAATIPEAQHSSDLKGFGIFRAFLKPKFVKHNGLLARFWHFGPLYNLLLNSEKGLWSGKTSCGRLVGIERMICRDGRE